MDGRLNGSREGRGGRAKGGGAVCRSIRRQRQETGERASVQEPHSQSFGKSLQQSGRSRF